MEPQLTPEQIERYSRHVLLPDIGGRGQKRLLAAKVAKLRVFPDDVECLSPDGTGRAEDRHADWVYSHCRQPSTTTIATS